jgi:hypothetical protein
MTRITPLLIHDAQILSDHGRDDLLVRLLVDDLALCEPVLLEELQVVSFLLQHPKHEDRQSLVSAMTAS